MIGMPIWEIVLLSVLLSPIAIYLLMMAKDLILHARCKFLVGKGEEIANDELKYLICVSGPIRVGKTSYCSGLINHYVSLLIKDASKTLDDFRELNPKVNFFILDYFIRRLYKVYIKEKPDGGLLWVSDQLIAGYHGHQYGKIFSGDYDNGINSTPMLLKFRQYVIAYCRLLDGNFVMSNIPHYCPITNTYSRQISPDDMDIKKAFQEKRQFVFEQYNVIYFDDFLTSDKISSNYQAVAAEDGGAAFLERLFGNMFEEKDFMVINCQRVLRIVKEDRENLNKVVVIDGKESIGELGCFSMPLQFLHDHELKKEAKQKHLIDQLSPSSRKQFIFRIRMLLDRLFSISYLRYQLRVYDDIDDVKMAPTKGDCCRSYNFVFPVLWAYGGFDTHYYRVVLDYFRKNSSGCFSDLQVRKETLSESAIVSMLERNPDKRASYSSKFSNKAHYLDGDAAAVAAPSGFFGAKED